MAESLDRGAPAPGPAPSPAISADAPLACVGRRGRLLEIDAAVLAIDGRPHWGAAAELLDDEALGRRLIGVLRERGPAGLEDLNGDFALAFFDRRNRKGLIAIDKIGMRGLVYARQGAGLVFGSSLDALVAHGASGAELDPQAIYNYLFFHVVPGPQTIYKGSERLLAGHCIEFDGSSVQAARPYWRMRFVEDRRAPLADLKRGFVDALQRSVATAAARRPCGAFLSGGTDSSTVSGMLGRATGAAAQTFSIGFDAAGYDEMEYARIAARHFKTEHHEYYVTPDDVVAAAPRIAAAYDQPFGNSSAVPAYYCARMAQQHGVAHLLAGDGGDELFGGNERYAKQQLFGHYHRLPAALRSALMEPALLGPDFTARLPLLRKARRYVEQARVPMPARYEGGNQIDHIGRETIFEPGFLAAIDAGQPSALMRAAHAPYADRSLVNQMMGIDLRFILADGDLPKVTRMCELAGVDVSFPLLDQRVIDFSAELAPELKLRGLKLRWLFKEALRDFLPHEIIVKQKHGFGLPVGNWLASHPALFDLAQSSLMRLKTRGIVRPEFIDRLTGPLLHEHAKYFGPLVWVLMILSLWLDSRRL